MAYDDIIVLTGEFGRYQRRIFILFCLATVPIAFHTMAGVFLGAAPDFRCLLPFESPEDATYQLPSDLMDVAYPSDGSNGSWSQCERYDLNFTDQDYDSVVNLSMTTSTIKCDDFVYDRTTYELTTTTGFDLVCDKAWLKATADSLFMVGNLIGVLTSGPLSDRYGRKTICCSVLIVNIVSGLLMAASPEIISYIIFRMVLGSTLNTLYIVIYVNAVEMVIPKRRSMIGSGMQLFFSCGNTLTTAFAYFITNWRILQVAITIPSIAFLGYWWLIPESVRWLLSKGRLQEAKVLILKASSENGVELSEATLDDMLSDNCISRQPDSKKPSVLDLFRYQNLRRKSLILFLVWFANSSTYYGLSWNTSSLVGSDYVNFAISGLVEIPACALIFSTLDRWGRKIILCGSLIFSGLALLIITFVPSDLSWLVVLLAMMGKFAITCSFIGTYVSSAEQYPTVIRNIGMGTCSTCARIGGIMAPYIIYSSSAWTPLPYMILGSCSLIAGLSALLLPETLNKKLLESIEDGEAFGNIQSYASAEQENHASWLVYNRRNSIGWLLCAYYTFCIFKNNHHGEVVQPKSKNRQKHWIWNRQSREETIPKAAGEKQS